VGQFAFNDGEFCLNGTARHPFRTAPHNIILLLTRRTQYGAADIPAECVILFYEQKFNAENAFEIMFFVYTYGPII